MDQSFTKTERLSSLKAIGELFSRQEGGHPSFLVYPYKVIYRKIEPGTLVGPFKPSILISVSKKKFKKAVDRNRIKRLTREAYRKNKVLFEQPIHIAFIYVGKDIMDYAQIEKSMVSCLARINI